MPDHSPSTALRFLLNGEPVVVGGCSPQTTLLEYLREQRRLTGTKEGCAEGDCGACTVVLAEIAPVTGAIAWQPINACIRLLPSVAGKAVFTIESLAATDGAQHPVQQAMVACHASQCGFCTPGFTMSLFGLYKSGQKPTRAVIEDALSGNLCRCTGYRPIVEAALAMVDFPSPNGWRGAVDIEANESTLKMALAALADPQPLQFSGDGATWFAPRTVDQLAAVVAAHPAARIVAGATDVGLWVTKQHKNIGDIVYVGDVADLRRIDTSATHVELGAAVSLTAAFAALDSQWPELHEAWVRFASVPIRNSGTLGGNIANGSPIGDSMPALMALGATVILRHRDRERELPLEELYIAYQRSAMIPGEFLVRIRIPRRAPGLSLRAYKISKRFDQDISAVFVCFALTIDREITTSARIGCGGVAATPRRATATEASLAGQRWNDTNAEAAADKLSSEFAPIGDMRASAHYRRTVLGNLLRRFRLETSGAPLTTRIAQVTLAAD
ncbi:MAG: xanthine dehydrogenase small subunit [Betaproteobacteria bacterium]